MKSRTNDDGDEGSKEKCVGFLCLCKQCMAENWGWQLVNGENVTSLVQLVTAYFKQQEKLSKMSYKKKFSN